MRNKTLISKRFHLYYGCFTTNASKMGRKVEKKGKGYIRKVTLLKYNDRKDGLIISRTVTTTREKLTIKVQCKSRVEKTANKDIKKKQIPIFKVALKERIVPCCLRPKCSNKNIRTNHQRDNRNRRRCKHKIRNDARNLNTSTSSSMSLIEISDDNLANYGLGYGNISSDSSFTDDEIDTLIESTRKRMKDLDTDWLLLPRQHTSTSSTLNTSKDMSQSTNSLDTLVLDEEPIEYPDVCNIKNETYSSTLSSTKGFYEMETNNNIIKFETFNNIQLDHNSSQYLYKSIKIKEEKKLIYADKLVETDNNNIKLETFNNIKSEHSSKDSELYKNINIKEEKKFIDSVEPMESNNNNMKLKLSSKDSQYLYEYTKNKKENKFIDTLEQSSNDS